MNRIPAGITRVDVLAQQTDNALADVESIALSGYISKGILRSPTRSYLFDDNGTLKFYSAVTGLVTTV